MKVITLEVSAARRLASLKSWLNDGQRRLGLITSVDGSQLITLVLDPAKGEAQCWESNLDVDQYPSLTPSLPQCHWFERAVWDSFGLYPDGHPRLKNLLLHDQYGPEFMPLRSATKLPEIVFAGQRKYEFLRVHGDGVYEIPVGPIHAGIIEPGHFRLSCLGEVILNLEIRLGYLHRGIEKRLTEVSWKRARFVAEAASSDTAVGNALAHVTALESLTGIRVPLRAQFLRSLALEIERMSMHIADIGGMATDIGYLGIASSLARLRGTALRFGEVVAGSRFLRGYICAGGVVRDPGKNLDLIRQCIRRLRFDLEKLFSIFLENPVVQERFDAVGHISNSLAREFGLVGVTARACGIAYDTRCHFSSGVYPQVSPAIAVEAGGDVLARVKVRIEETYHSISLANYLLETIPEGPVWTPIPESLPGNQVGLGIVEAFRGELIHLIFTDGAGRIKRYAIKDPSFNNWTGVSIAVRNNLVADFPICNKSFGLSYSGHDL